MKNIIVTFFCCFVHISAFCQKADSIAVLDINTAKTTTISLDTTSIKDDSLKKKNFITKKIDKIGKWSPPKKAAMLSLILPGAGQIYNKKGVWWRLPLCYGAYTFTIVTHIQLRKQYFFFKDIYEWRVNQQKGIAQGDFPTTLYGKKVSSGYKTASLQAIYNDKNNARNPYERSFIWLGAAHLYCVADAFVTAHLRAFDISEDLSLKIQPKYDWVSQKPMVGLALQF